MQVEMKQVEEMQDSAIQEEESAVPFQITNDKMADWAVRKIKEECETADRLTALADAQVREITRKADDARAKAEKSTENLRCALESYFATVKHRKTKTTEKYALLSGTLTLKKGKDTAKVVEPDALVAWLKSNGRNEYVQATEKPKWGEFKKLLSVSGGVAVISATGEVVDADAVTVEPVPDKFQIDF